MSGSARFATREVRPPADLGRRVAANLIDNAVLGVALLVLIVVGAMAATVAGSSGLALLGLGVPLLMFAYSIYTFWRLATQGLSVGKQVMGVRLVSADDQQPIGWGRVFLRQLVLAVVSGATFGIGLIVLLAVAAKEPRRRGWHDLAAGSMVVDDRGAPLVAAAIPRQAPAALSPLVEVALPPGVPASPGRAQATPAPVAPPFAMPPPVAAPPVPTPVSTPRAPARGGVIAEVPGFSTSPPVQAPEPAPQDYQPALDLDVERTRLPTARRAPSDSWHLDVGSGQVVKVSGSGLLGRAPEPRDDEQVVHLVAVTDGTRSVSKTHLAFGVDEQGLWVLDRHSTNGSAVVTADGVQRPCAAGVRVRVAPGESLLVGDHPIAVSRR